MLADTGDGQISISIFQAGRFDAVMHFAAFIEAGESMISPEIFFDNNSAKALTLLRAMLQHRVPRFVFSSTAAVYGEPRRAAHHGRRSTGADQRLRRIEAGRGADAGLVPQVHGLRYASLRYFNAAGATADRGEAHRPETHLIPLVLQVALGQREAISIYGTDYPTKDGTCVRDYIHIEDLATAHLLALDGLAEHSHEDSQLICNLGSGSGFSVREIIDDRRQVTGKDSRRSKRRDARRSGGAGGQLGEDQASAGLESAALGRGSDCAQRVGVAQSHPRD